MNKRFWRERSADEFATCMAMDAFRLARGNPTLNFTPDEVIRWLKAMSRAALRTRTTEAQEG